MREAAGARGPRPRSRSLPLAEAVADERAKRFHRLDLVGAGHFERDLRSLPRGEHHDAHDALGVDLAAIALDLHVAVEFRGELRELRRRTRVQPELVDDLDFAAKHFLSRCQTWRTPSHPPEMAFLTSVSIPRVR